MSVRRLTLAVAAVAAIVAGCSTLPRRAPEPEATIPLSPLPPARACDASALAAELPPIGDRRYEGTRMILEETDREQLPQWLATAHCTTTTPNRQPPSTASFRWAHAARTRATELAAAHRSEEATDVLLSSWAAVQNDAFQGSLVQSAVALSVEAWVLEDLDAMLPSIGPSRRIALARDIAWLHARQPTPSAAADVVLLAELDVSSASLTERAELWLYRWRATPGMAAELDERFARHDAAGLQAVADQKRWLPDYRKGASKVLVSLLQLVDENEAAVAALLERLG